MIGVAIVGCGGVGRNHLAALRRCPGARVAAVVDIVPELARLVAQETGARWTTRVEEMLAWPDVDAVDICTPNSTHADLAVASARAGKHLLVEKPLATTLTDADRILSACRECRVTLMVAHTHRFYDYARTIRAALDAGTIGRPLYLRIAAGGGFWPTDWGAWQLDAGRSGGHALHNGVHLMDLANHLFADTPVWVYAQGLKQTSAHLEIFDYFHVVIGYAGGGTAACEMSRSAVPRGLGYRALLLLGDRGELALDWDGEQQVILTERGLERFGGDGQEGFDRVVSAWVEAVRAGRQPPVTGEAGRLAVVMSLAAERSLETGRVVPLAEVDGRG